MDGAMTYPIPTTYYMVTAMFRAVLELQVKQSPLYIEGREILCDFYDFSVHRICNTHTKKIAAADQTWFVMRTVC
jgi:hypothetical protein